jgi:hypothetical protein
MTWELLVVLVLVLLAYLVLELLAYLVLVLQLGRLPLLLPWLLPLRLRRHLLLLYQLFRPLYRLLPHLS